MRVLIELSEGEETLHKRSTCFSGKKIKHLWPRGISHQPACTLFRWQTTRVLTLALKQKVWGTGGVLFFPKTKHKWHVVQCQTAFTIASSSLLCQTTKKRFLTLNIVKYLRGGDNFVPLEKHLVSRGKLHAEYASKQKQIVILLILLKIFLNRVCLLLFLKEKQSLSPWSLCLHKHKLATNCAQSQRIRGTELVPPRKHLPVLRRQAQDLCFSA